MNLQEHKQLLRQYEHGVRELRSLREVQTCKPDAPWKAVYGDHEMYIPREWVATMVRDRIGELEAETKELAAKLGITHEVAA